MRGLVCLYVCFVCSENRIYCKKKVLFLRIFLILIDVVFSLP